MPTSEVEPTASIRLERHHACEPPLPDHVPGGARAADRNSCSARAEPAEAIKITNAAAKGAAEWVRDTQNRQLVPDSRRTQLTQLGAATGGTVNAGASRIVAALAFIVILAAGSLLVLLVGNTIPAVRRANGQPHVVEALPTTAAASGRGSGNARTARGTGAKAGQAQRAKTRAGRRAS